MIKIIVRLQTKNKLLTIYNEIYNNSAYHNIVAKVNNEIVGLATVITNYDIVEHIKNDKEVYSDETEIDVEYYCKKLK